MSAQLGYASLLTRSPKVWHCFTGLLEMEGDVLIKMTGKTLTQPTSFLHIVATYVTAITNELAYTRHFGVEHSLL